MKRASPAEVAAEISRLEVRLGQLRRRHRAMVGGRASGTARGRRYRNEQIRTFYRQKEGEPRVVKVIAAETGLSERQVRRILRPGGGEGDAATDGSGRASRADEGRSQQTRPSGNALLPEDTGSGAPSVRLANNELAQLEADYPEILSLEDRFRRAENIIYEMFEQANEARIPGGRQFDLETAIRLIEDFADEWNDYISSLRAAFEPKRRHPQLRRRVKARPSGRT